MRDTNLHNKDCSEMHSGSCSQMTSSCKCPIALCVLSELNCRWLLMVNDSMYHFPKVLAESEQMRKEADDVGPKAELEHWKKRMAKFNSLVDQIKGTDCKAVVGVLHAAKSKLLKVL